MQSTEELYKDVVETWKFIRNHNLPSNDNEWSALIEAVSEFTGGDDMALKMHLVVGYLNYLQRWDMEKNEKR